MGDGVLGLGVTVGRLLVGIEEWVFADVGEESAAVGMGDAVAWGTHEATGERNEAGAEGRIGCADGGMSGAEAWEGVPDGKTGSADGWFVGADGCRCAVMAQWVKGRGRMSAAGTEVAGGAVRRASAAGEGAVAR